MNGTIRSFYKICIVGVVLFGTAITCFAEANPMLDPKNWKGYVVENKDMVDIGKQITTTPEGGLVLPGFHLGREAQYSLGNAFAKKFENKLVTVTMTFNGQFVGMDSSFIALAQRGSAATSIFWSQQCYALLFKSNQIEVQKQGKGTNPNLIYKYADIPALGFKTFPIGKPVKVTYGIVTEGPFPRMIVKVNDVPICNVLDNKYGQTVRPQPNNLFLVGVIATNKEEASTLKISKSNLVINDIKVE